MIEEINSRMTTPRCAAAFVHKNATHRDICNQAFKIGARYQLKTTVHSLSISSILDFSNESGLGLRSRDQSFSKVCVFSELTRPHDADTQGCVFKSFRHVFKSSRFHRKRYIVFIVFVWTGHENATKCLRSQMKTHPCRRGLG